MIVKRLFVIASVLLLANISLHAATAQAAPQQIAFIGDNFTWEWQQSPQFQAHSNWLPYGTQIDGAVGNPGMQYAQQTLETIIASGKKPVVHLIIGESDEEAVFLYPHFTPAGVFANFISGLDQFITTAQDAKLTLIVGTIPYTVFGNVSDMNQWIFADCAKHGVPVINYDYALNTTFPNDWAPPTSAPNGWELRPLTPAGYSLVTDMAAVAIGTATGTLKLKGGYLNSVVSNSDPHNPGVAPVPIINGNTVYDSGSGYVGFTAYGQYSDGSTHAFYNANENGQIGTWTNSNPLVLNLTQLGVGMGMQLGATNVKFITPSGVTLNEWTMYSVDPPEYPF